MGRREQWLEAWLRHLRAGSAAPLQAGSAGMWAGAEWEEVMVNRIGTVQSLGTRATRPR